MPEEFHGQMNLASYSLGGLQSQTRLRRYIHTQAPRHTHTHNYGKDFTLPASNNSGLSQLRVREKREEDIETENIQKQARRKRR